jgi:small conductance mechanosensitive channel
MDDYKDELSDTYESLFDKLYSWFDTAVLQLPNLIIAVIILVASYFISKYIKKLVSNATRKITSNRTLINLAGNLTAVFFSLAVLFLLLTIFNLGGAVNKILATAGVLGLAVGLALQDPVNNLFSGVSMAIREMYSIGDLVETNGYFGSIQDISLRFTKLKLASGEIVVIPNKDVIQKPMKNYTTSGERRIDISCGVSYDDDLQEVELLVRKVIGGMDGIIPSKSIEVVFDEFADSSINFSARFWIETGSQKDYVVEKSKALKLIKEAFDKKGISIPYPIVTLDLTANKAPAFIQELITKKQDLKRS